MKDESFGELVKKHRETRGLTKAEVARRLNVQRSTPAHWEDDTNKPQGPLLVKLADVLELKLDKKIELFKAAGNEELAKLAELGSQAFRSDLVSAPDIITNYINTKGGTYIRGNMNTGGGDFASRDKVALQSAGTTAPKILMQRPKRVPYFTGRENEVEQILKDLQPGRVITLVGPGGIGKSALAAQVVWLLAPDDKPAERFPDGIIFHDFSLERAVTRVLEQIAYTFHEEPRPTLLAAAQRALAGRRALLVLDAIENADDLQLLLSIHNSCGVLMTSRLHHKIVEGPFHDLKPLSYSDANSEAIILLQKWGRARAIDQEAVRRICELCGGLPLALRLAGRYMAEREEDAVDYLAWLEKTPLTALDLGQRQDESIPLLLEHNLEQVTEGARQALAITGLLALGSFNREAVADALEVSIVEASRILGELVNYSLLERPMKRYQVTHALIHTYAKQRMAKPSLALLRLALFYLKFAKEQSELGSEGDIRLNTERAHLLSLLTHCVEQEVWIAVHGLAGTIDEYLALPLYSTDSVTVYDSGLKAAKILGYRQAEGGWLGRLGAIYYNQGQEEKAIAHFQQALAIAREIHEREEEGWWLGALGISYSHLGKNEQAMGCLMQALEIARELANQRMESQCLANLGFSYYALGQIEQAIEYNQQGLTIAQKIGSLQMEMLCMGNLAGLYIDQGKVTQGIKYSQQALTIARELVDRQLEVQQMLFLNTAYTKLGQIEQAIEYSQQGLIIAQEIGDPSSEIECLSSLGMSYLWSEEPEQAIKYFEQALVIAQKVGHRFQEWLILTRLGQAYNDWGRYQYALNAYQRATELDHEGTFSKRYFSLTARSRVSNKLWNWSVL